MCQVSGSVESLLCHLPPSHGRFFQGLISAAVASVIARDDRRHLSAGTAGMIVTCAVIWLCDNRRDGESSRTEWHNQGLLVIRVAWPERNRHAGACNDCGHRSYRDAATAGNDIRSAYGVPVTEWRVRRAMVLDRSSDRRGCRATGYYTSPATGPAAKYRRQAVHTVGRKRPTLEDDRLLSWKCFGRRLFHDDSPA